MFCDDDMCLNCGHYDCCCKDGEVNRDDDLFQALEDREREN